jgi:hypothetical protein
MMFRRARSGSWENMTKNERSAMAGVGAPSPESSVRNVKTSPRAVNPSVMAFQRSA